MATVKSTDECYIVISDATLVTAWSEAEAQKIPAQNLVSHVWDGSAHQLTFSIKNPKR